VYSRVSANLVVVSWARWPAEHNPGKEEPLSRFLTLVVSVWMVFMVGSSTVAAPAQAAATPTRVTASETVATAPMVVKATSRASHNRAIGRSMAAKRHWIGGQWTCLNRLFTRESHWNHRAKNPYSAAYGIPQANPGKKMRSAGRDWRTNPRTQITWGLRYIKSRYRTPCRAWAHSQATGWY
jgi:Transglycosylase SLT domain